MAAAGKGVMRASREFPSNEPIMWPKVTKSSRASSLRSDAYTARLAHRNTPRRIDSALAQETLPIPSCAHHRSVWRTLQIFWAMVGSTAGAWALWRGQQVQ